MLPLHSACRDCGVPASIGTSDVGVSCRILSESILILSDPAGHGKTTGRKVVFLQAADDRLAFFTVIKEIVLIG